MRNRNNRRKRAACGIGFAVAGSLTPAIAGDVVEKSAPLLSQIVGTRPVVVDTVIFRDRRHLPVQVVRGIAATPIPARAPLRVNAPLPATAAPRSTEIVSFGSGRVDQVTIVRGGGAGMPLSLAHRADLPPWTYSEKISFGDAQSAVTVVRGVTATALAAAAARDPIDFDLFGPASIGELDRVAFAVDGMESRHGADLRMWRPSPTGPQGPMQVSEAAANDVGGGNRFDLRENRLIGRAYLAQMFRRYGNWADALGAYNWGPGAMDQWIAGGRRGDRLPVGVANYISRGMRDAFLTKTAGL
ncbi:MAG TPA: lytic transglycosylase domain-containing protein [Stellaceae bacterium]|jgi:hypothetical protein|nr:lytic transglycosylase domain-containing protein [Stellaceae bacterium]